MKQLLRLFFSCLLGLSFVSGLPSRAAGQPTAAAVAPPARPLTDRTLVLYPNPSTGMVQLTINGLEGRRVELSVINVIGTVLYHETLTELNERYTKTLDLTRFASGLYYVKLEANNTSQLSKLVIR